MDLKITPSGQTIVKPTALGPVANTDTKLLIYGLFQKGRVLAQDGQDFLMVRSDRGRAATQLIVVLNWSGELARRVPRRALTIAQRATFGRRAGSLFSQLVTT